MGNQRFNQDLISALSSPSRARVFTDFSLEIILDDVSREVWIFGTGDIEWKPADSSMFTWTVDNVNMNSIFVTAKMIEAFGTGTTVDKIIVWD